MVHQPLCQKGEGQHAERNKQRKQHNSRGGRKVFHLNMTFLLDLKERQRLYAYVASEQALKGKCFTSLDQNGPGAGEIRFSKNMLNPSFHKPGHDSDCRSEQKECSRTLRLERSINGTSSLLRFARSENFARRSCSSHLAANQLCISGCAISPRSSYLEEIGGQDAANRRKPQGTNCDCSRRAGNRSG